MLFSIVAAPISTYILNEGNTIHISRFKKDKDRTERSQENCLSIYISFK